MTHIEELEEMHDELCALLCVPEPNKDEVVRMLEKHRSRREEIMVDICSMTD